MTSWYRRFGKRSLDIALSIAIQIFFLPLMLAIALAIRLTMGKELIYKQKRPGIHGHPFVIRKFRTMREIRDANGELVPDNRRLTIFGQFLRRTSLDELPELINVLRGEMSLVGPRPLLMGYLGLYTAEQARRHEVKPGITGWAQVNGRNAITWEEKFKYDVWYADNWSIWLDLKILWMTLTKVIKMEGINQPGRATVDYFRDSSLGVHENEYR